MFRNLLAQAQWNSIPVVAIVNNMSALDVDGELIGKALDRLLSRQDPDLVGFYIDGHAFEAPWKPLPMCP